MRRQWILPIVFLLTTSLGVLAQGTELRVALVIGNADYANSPLTNPVNDASDMASTLRESGFTVALRLNADRQEMWEAIREFGDDLSRGGVGLFFYSGHGMQITGRNYLIPVRSDIMAEDEVQYSSRQST